MRLVVPVLIYVSALWWAVWLEVNETSCARPKDTPYCHYVCIGDRAICEYDYTGETDEEFVKRTGQRPGRKTRTYQGRPIIFNSGYQQTQEGIQRGQGHDFQDADRTESEKRRAAVTASE